MATAADELGLGDMIADKAPKFNFLRAFQNPLKSPKEAHIAALMVLAALVLLFLIHKGFRPLVARG